MEDDGFTLVSKKRGFRKSKTKLHKGYSPHELSADSTQDQILASVERCRIELRKSAFMKEIDSIVGCLQTELRPVDVVCYGIGKMDSLYSQAPKYQLAALLYIMEMLKIENPLFYDPVLSEVEIDAIQSYKLKDIAINEEAKRKVDVRTLFVMFHAEKFLFENLIEANIANLDLVSILGNDLDTMYNFKHLHVLDSIKKIRLENIFYKDCVFDCCALQWFVA